MRKRTWTDDQLAEAVKEAESVYGVFRILKLKVGGSQHMIIKKKIKELGLDTSHFLGRGWSKGKKLNHSFTKRDLKEILVENSDYTKTSGLKFRLIREGLLKNKCNECGLEKEWNSKPITLQIDHINGKRDDNRIENLRILCPNCHSQTYNFCGRNKEKNKTKTVKAIKRKQNKQYKCKICGGKTNRNSKNKLCWTCWCVVQRKTKRPDIRILKEQINLLGYRGTSRKYSVSDNALRKWIEFDNKYNGILEKNIAEEEDIFKKEIKRQKETPIFISDGI